MNKFFSFVLFAFLTVSVFAKSAVITKFTSVCDENNNYFDAVYYSDDYSIQNGCVYLKDCDVVYKLDKDNEDTEAVFKMIKSGPKIKGRIKSLIIPLDNVYAIVDEF